MYLPVMAPLRAFFAQARWNDQPVVTVFGGPDRAHTEAARVFAQKLQLTRQQVEDQGLPRPFMSVWRSHPTFDQARDSRAVVRGFNRDLKASTALRMRYPQPKTSDIQVDLWCGEGGHQIAEVVTAQIDMLFPHESVYLPVDWSLDKWYKPPFDVFRHARVYGRTRAHLVRSGDWTDNSELELQQGNKDVRLTWQGRYDFYVPYRPEEARLVRDINIQLLDATANDEVIETFAVSAED